MPLASQSPYPIIVSSVANYRPILVTFRQICNFRDPNLVTYYFYELTHFLDWIKNTLLFIYSTKILIRLLTVNTLFFFYKNVVFPGQAEYCYFPADFRLKIFLYYRKSSIKPPGGLIFCKHFWGGGLKRERGGLFNLAKRITCTVVWDRVDLRIVQLKSPSKVFNSLVGA